MEMRITNISHAVLVTRGVMSLLFGIIILVWPAITLHVILVLFALYVLIAGAASAIGSVVDRHENEAWPLGLIFGTIAAFIGLYLLDKPNLTAVVVVYLIGLYAVMAGILDIVAGIALRKQIKGEWVLIVVGLLTLAFGLYLFANPGAGAVALVWLIGIYSLISGVLWLAAAASHHTASRQQIANSPKLNV